MLGHILYPAILYDPLERKMKRITKRVSVDDDAIMHHDGETSVGSQPCRSKNSRRAWATDAIVPMVEYRTCVDNGTGVSGLWIEVATDHGLKR